MRSTHQQYQLTIRLFGLFLKCPFREATMDCPFIDIRNLSSLELKFKLAEQMACHPSCQENVSNTHEMCYRKRMRQVTQTCQGGRSDAPTTQQGAVCHRAALASL